jgi:hypothetical protein
MAEADIIRVMHYAGEKFVTDARGMSKAAGGFGDVTGNLRSSIGYFILRNWEVIDSNLTGTPVGQLAARIVIDIVGRKPGLQFIGVAGMEYASHVESRGLNVISMQADTCIIDLEKYFKVIENKYRS